MSMEWNRNLYERIRAAADRGAVHHALLLTGPKGSGKGELARFIAAAMECQAPQGRPCGVCPACRKVFDGIHPDVIAVRDEERKLLSVDTVRQVCADAYIRPNEGVRKVYIIDPADTMNPVAQNALLKVLEDGPDYTAFLLLTAQPGLLLGTIRSRCETLRLPPEEESKDPELERRGAELAHLLLTGSEWEVAQGLTALELEKWKGGQLLDLMAAAEPVVAAELARNRRAVSVLRALKTCRDNGVYNVGTGHTLGWLCGELFR